MLAEPEGKLRKRRCDCVWSHVCGTVEGKRDGPIGPSRIVVAIAIEDCCNV